tara:strand:+ start:669 stop:860 length:192 start_codon:yes stop_codon:yes gene_type:complete
MTPKEKAMEIAMKFDKDGQTDNAVKCALICVEEILDIIRYHGTYIFKSSLKYWLDVKHELSLL